MHVPNCKHFLCGVSSSILCMRKENTCWIGSCNTLFWWSDNFEQKCKENYTTKFIFYPQNYKIATLIREIDIRYLSIYQGYCRSYVGLVGWCRCGRLILNEGYWYKETIETACQLKSWQLREKMTDLPPLVFLNRKRIFCFPEKRASRKWRHPTYNYQKHIFHKKYMKKQGNAFHFWVVSPL